MIDVDELLKRHASAFGSEAAVAATLPRRSRGEAEINGSKSAFTRVFEQGRYRMETSIAGIAVAAGLDERGAWSLSVDGVVHRLDREEAIGVHFDDWLARRHYLHAIDPKRDAARCETTSGVPRVTIAAKLAELGDPELVFDFDSTRLEAASHTSADGLKQVTEIHGWSQAEGGARFPSEWVERPEAGSPILVKVDAEERRVRCDAACTLAPADAFVIAWPKDERVTVPMRLYNSELSLRAQVAGRGAWALLDSGAGVSAVDATTPLGAAFKPALHVEGIGATQKVTLGLGELRDVTIAGLVMPRLPVVSVPIPALDNFGSRRPELIVGYSIFAAAAVRVDYQRSEIVLAKTAEKLHGARATFVPLRYWRGKPVAEFEVDGARGFIELDTGNGGGVNLHKRWAAAHGLPGSARTVDVRYRGGAGTEETSTTLWRAKKATLGPITVEKRIVQIDDPPSGSRVAGLIGNDVFARCAAVIFDVRERKVWFEPPCDRPVPEQLAGWHLEHKLDPAFSDRPWVVGKVIADGPAARAGLLPNDRVLSVGGKPATLDRESFAAQLAQPAGTAVNIEFARDGKKRTVSLQLAPILGD